jgi:hypothetical protein
LLLPFTHGVDMYALEYAVHLAKNSEAEIIAVSFITRAKEALKAVRLEHIQQSRDFEVALDNKAGNYGVPLHYVEVCTRDAVSEINCLVQEHECEGILLFVRKGQGVLLQTREIKRLMVEAMCKLYIVRLPSGEGRKALQDMIRDGLLRLGKRTKDDAGNLDPILFSNSAGEQFVIASAYLSQIW